MTSLVDSPISYDMGVFAGQDTVLDFVIYVRGTTQAQVDADQITPNAAIREDLTGWTLAWKMRLGRSHPLAILEKDSSGGGGITVDPDQVAAATKGVAHVSIDRTDLEDHVGGTYFHGLARTNTGDYDVVADGSIRIRRATV